MKQNSIISRQVLAVLDFAIQRLGQFLLCIRRALIGSFFLPLTIDLREIALNYEKHGGSAEARNPELTVTPDVE
jgi:hypothetical protein